MRADTILIVDDEKLIRWSLCQELTKEGYATHEAATLEEGRALFDKQGADLIILDQILPDGEGIDLLRHVQESVCCTPVIMLTAVDRSSIAVQAMRLGAFEYVTKPINMDELKVLVENALEATRLKREIAYLRKAQMGVFGSNGSIGSSPAMQIVFDFIQKVAPSNATTILITGESGTGKELVARAIHSASSRRERPLMAINCSAIPESLIESELFGHEQGAFTDARSQKRGLFELANGGTIFLDEIGDITPTLQVKLLRVLETKAFRRVGGTMDVVVDVRIIAATNQILEQRVDEGKFRPDLYYRLNVASVQLPPLRDRGEDVLLLAEHFLQDYSRSFHKRFRGMDPQTRRAFLQYRWPGNVRELKNVIERSVLLNDGECLLPEHIDLKDLQSVKRGTAIAITEESDGPSLHDLEKAAITQALDKAMGNQSKAARILKISRDTLRYRMKKFGLMKRHR